jgi:hypothetical protein
MKLLSYALRSVKSSTNFVRLVTTGMSFHTGIDPSNYITINIWAPLPPRTSSLLDFGVDAIVTHAATHHLCSRKQTD